MAVFVIVWNLNKEGAAYADVRAKFFELLSKTDYSYSSTLETTAFVSTASNVDQIYDYFRQAMDDNDRLLVSLLVEGYYKGWLDKTQTEWISARM